MVTASGSAPACTVVYSTVSQRDSGFQGSVTAASESWNGTLANGASITAGFLASGAGSGCTPDAFRLNGPLRNADPDPDPTDYSQSPTGTPTPSVPP